jgi:multidrug efflux pump subunit AcrB
MSLAQISIRRPVFAWMLMIALIVFGGIAFTKLGVSQWPDIDLPVVNVQLSLPGAAPEVMESDVVDVLETALIQVDGITQMSSTCRQSMANIKLEFDLNRDIDAAIQDVQTRIAQSMRSLPVDMDPRRSRSRIPRTCRSCGSASTGPALPRTFPTISGTRCGTRSRPSAASAR